MTRHGNAGISSAAMRRRAYRAAAILFVAVTALAEVRISRDAAGGPRLTVREVAGGVWTARGNTRDGILNPEGDARGDGSPDAAAVDGSLVAAWQNAATQSLSVLRVSAEGDKRVHDVALPALPFGTPAVRSVGSGWVIGTQVLTPEPAIVVVGVSTSEVSAPEFVLPGQFLDVLVIGDEARILSFVEFDRHIDVLTLHLHLPIPMPIPGVLSRVDLTLAPRAVAGTGTNRKDPVIDAPCIAPTDDGYILAWSGGNGQIGRVFIDQFGISEREIVEGPNGSCQAILNAAQRE